MDTRSNRKCHDLGTQMYVNLYEERSDTWGNIAHAKKNYIFEKNT